MGTWRNNRRASRRDPAAGAATPLPWSGPASTANLRAWYNDEDASIASGTDTTGLYKVANIPNNASASLGGTIAQGTASLQPKWGSCKGGKARCWFSSSTLTSSLAAINYKLKHQFISGCSYAFYFKIRSAANTNIINTKASAGTGVGVGTTVAALNTDNIRVSIGDGTANQSVDTTSNTLTANVGHSVIVRLSQTEANKVEIFIDGISAGSATSLTIAPSASNPGATLSLTNAFAFVDSYMLWETYMPDADIPRIHTWLMDRYGQELTTMADAVTFAATMVNPPAEMYSFNVSGIVNNLAAHAATGVGSPTTSTNASYNSKYVFDCGTGKYYTANTLSTNMSGTDKPQGYIVVGNQATTDTTNKTLCSTGSSLGANNQHKRLEFSSGNVTRIHSADDAGGTDTDAGATAVGTGAVICGAARYGTTANAWLGLVLELSEATNDVGATTVDLFTLFALVQAGALASSTELNGKAAAAFVWDAKAPNEAVYRTFHAGLKAEFAL